MIRYHGFTKRFGAVEAVRDLDLAIEEGETIALIGPNGSGKTTTLKAALGLVRPTSGRVEVAGIDAGHRAARARLGYLPQRLTFPDGCTAREALRLYARLRGATDDLDRLLARVGLEHAADRPANQFSGGMRQRLGLAIAHLGRPRALVLDEPTAALDPSGALVVRDLVEEIRAGGTTVVLSSHDLAEVAALADRVGVFVQGRLQALGTPDELVRHLRLPARLRVALADVTHVAVGADAAVSIARTEAERAGARAVRFEGGVLHCEVAPGGEARVLEAIRGCGAAVSEISLHTPGLEEVYRAITIAELRRSA